jgi:phosphoserine phosphatase
VLKEKTYRAVISSDWSECLSPNGPFDPFAFTYPQIKGQLERIFREYTGNIIGLGQAVVSLKTLIPKGLNQSQMDNYLDASFCTYRGVPELIQWCLDREILIMINSTGSQGYFQRAIFKGLIPEIPIIAANPLTQYAEHMVGDRYNLEVLEIDDKAKNSLAVLRDLGLSADRLIVVGDSGGDGPHFVRGFKNGAHLIGSMVKPSLVNYCQSHGAEIKTFFGIVYKMGESRDLNREMQYDFMDLTGTISRILGV